VADLLKRVHARTRGLALDAGVTCRNAHRETPARWSVDALGAKDGTHVVPAFGGCGQDFVHILHATVRARAMTALIGEPAAQTGSVTSPAAAASLGRCVRGRQESTVMSTSATHTSPKPAHRPGGMGSWKYHTASANDMVGAMY